VRYSESPAASGLVLTLLSDQVVKNFRISQADLYQNGVKLQSGGVSVTKEYQIAFLKKSLLAVQVSVH